jgi:acyl-CoA synthetase (AMP-forming)/AMP-acid ligase II
MEVIRSFSDMKYWDIDDCILNTTKKNNVDLKNNAHCYGGENVGLILMSSGSTGFPKGVQITHNNMIFILRNQ